MLGDVIRAVKRRWYVVIVVLAVFAYIGFSFMRDGGTYHARTVVWFTTDEAPTIVPENGSTDGQVISFAGAIATELNRGRPPANYAAASAPYYGAGVRQGVLVALRDVGGQWSSWYSAAVIELHIVGRTETWVADQRDDLLERIDETTRERAQAEDPEHSIAVSVEPLTKDISFIAPSRLQQSLAFAALTLAALLTAGYAARAVELFAQRARAAQSERPIATNERVTADA